MTVNELIEQLKNYPGDMVVLTLGYEGGYNDAKLTTTNIVFNVNDKDTWYYGPHECVCYVDGADESTECLIISRAK